MNTVGLTLAPVLALLASACTVHIHVHESPRDVAAARAPASSAQRSAPAVPSHEIRGVVVDGAGRPVHARVAAVGDSGSVSGSTDDLGRFALPQIHWPVGAVHASTEDGQVAVSALEDPSRELALQLRPGSKLSIDLRSNDSVRCAIFDGELRIEDFTLRAGETADVVVPAGSVRVQLYDGDRTYEERTVEIAVGDRRALTFELPSRS